MEKLFISFMISMSNKLKLHVDSSVSDFMMEKGRVVVWIGDLCYLVSLRCSMRELKFVEVGGRWGYIRELGFEAGYMVLNGEEWFRWMLSVKVAGQEPRGKVPNYWYWFILYTSSIRK